LHQIEIFVRYQDAEAQIALSSTKPVKIQFLAIFLTDE